MCPINIQNQAKTLVSGERNESSFRHLLQIVSRFDKECVTDETYSKVRKFASNLDPKRINRKCGAIAGALAAWVKHLMRFSSAVRETARDRAELRRLTEKLEEIYHGNSSEEDWE